MAGGGDYWYQIKYNYLLYRSKLNPLSHLREKNSLKAQMGVIKTI